MNEKHSAIIADELKLKTTQVQATARLLSEGGTVPFIARYRKEATDSLDEVQISNVRDRLEQLEELDKRKEAILKSLIERELLTPELKAQVISAGTMTELEDVYLPYRPKRRTRAMVARERGLEPLATLILAQNISPSINPVAEAEKFIDEEMDVNSSEEALQGARDIIAEIISEDKEARGRMRSLFKNKAVISSTVVKKKEKEGAKFRDYFEWNEKAADAPSHRILAMMRGEKEKFLSLNIFPQEGDAHQLIFRQFVINETPAAQQVKEAGEDSYKRLLGPSMETETRADLKKRADEAAIQVFAGNLKELLLASPLGEKRVLAIDPGFRTGCKVVCLDKQGQFLKYDTIYPHTGKAGIERDSEKIINLVKEYEIEAIAIGNGTASRETESFIKGLDIPSEIHVLVVNESGASIYSASAAAREEFPDHDITVRGSISIGRRLMDPLAELIKIDPKSIGVGQYQHDVDQTALRKSLDDVVMSCVNAVGVDLNTSSKQLLTYVSGLGPQLAGNIVAFRDENGPFSTRKDLRKVPRLGDKAFEQAAGFLRIREGKNPLDSSAVHPESYHIVKAMSDNLGCTIKDLINEEEQRLQIDLKIYITDNVGLPTLQDIMDELARPGRDPREKFEPFSFEDGVETMEDLEVGMQLKGIVTNVTAFGAFVDIGVHQDGLVHISHLADHFVKDPRQIVKVHQKVMVTVIEIDMERKRIALSMKSDPFSSKKKEPKKKREEPKPVSKPSSGDNWFTHGLKKGDKK